jgi:glycosidase
MAHWYKDSGPWWTNRNGKSNDGISLEEQRLDKKSLWNFYKTLLSIRKQYPAIQGGELKMISNDNPGVISFVRKLDQQEVLVVINLTSKPQEVLMQDYTSHSKEKVILSEPFGCNQYKQKIEMKAFGIFVAENK